MRMQRCLVALFAPAALGLGLSACSVRTTTMPEPSYPPPGGYARAPGAHVEHRETVAVGGTAPTEYYTESYPPEPLYEAMAPAPGDGHVWIDGSWHWNGYEWVWLGGNWVPEPVDLVYIEPHYGYQDDYYVYRPGHWTRREHVPRDVIVRDHRRHRPVTGHYPRPRPGDRPGTPLVRDHRRHDVDPGHGTPLVRDHRRHDVDPGNGAPPPRTGPPPRHQGPDQAGPPSVPRRPPPDISSPAARRGIPADRPNPGFGAPASRDHRDAVGASRDHRDAVGASRDHRDAGNVSGQPGAPPRITPRYTPPAPRGVPAYGGPPPRSAPAPRDHRGFGGAPPRSAPAPRDHRGFGDAPPRSAPAPRDHRNPAGAPPPRGAPAPRGVPSHGAPPPRSAPAARDHRGAGNVSSPAGTFRPQRPVGMPARRR